MKKLPILLFVGAVLVTGILSFRVVHLERCLEVAQRQQPASLPAPAGKPSVRTPASAPSSGAKIPDSGLAAELADARAELAGLKQQIQANQAP
jgi:hypothetical protein